MAQRSLASEFWRNAGRRSKSAGSAELGGGSPHQVLDLILLGDVRAHHQGTRAPSLLRQVGGLLEQVLAPGGDADASPFPGKLDRHVPADTRSGTRDDGDLALEAHVSVPSRRLPAESRDSAAGRLS